MVRGLLAWPTRLAPIAPRSETTLFLKAASKLPPLMAVATPAVTTPRPAIPIRLEPKLSMLNWASLAPVAPMSLTPAIWLRLSPPSKIGALVSPAVMPAVSPALKARFQSTEVPPFA